MKNAKKLLTAAMVALAAILISFGAACTNPVGDTLGAKNWGLVGTWIRSGSMTYGYYLVTYRSDGTFRVTDAPSPTVDISGTYTVGDISTAGSARTYQVLMQSPSFASPMYQLGRVSSGTQLEIVSSSMGGLYPTTISTSDMSYASFTRQ